MSLPSFRVGLPAYYVIATSEASANLARFDGVRYGPRHQARALACAARARCSQRSACLAGSLLLSAGRAV